MPNPKLAEQVAQVLGYAPDDAQLLLPRDGQQWIQNQMGGGRRKTSIGAAIAGAVFDKDVRTGGHVLGMPGPPEGPVVLALTPNDLVVLSTVAGFGRWKPTAVVATFRYESLGQLWNEQTQRTMYGVHLTMADGNHWEFSCPSGDMKKKYLPFEADLVARIQRAGGGQGAPAPGAPGAQQPGQVPGVQQPGAPVAPPPGQPQSEQAGPQQMWQPGPQGRSPQQPGQPQPGQPQPGQQQPGPPQPGQQEQWGDRPDGYQDPWGNPRR
ncbi:MAG: hypothetical protein ACTHW7_12875 [Actinomycetaceae bacterium]